MALSLTLNGVEYVGGNGYDVDFRTIIIQDSVELISCTMTFTININSTVIPRPKAGNEVIFKDGSDSLCAGVLVDVSFEFLEGSAIRYDCISLGYEFLLDRRRLNKTYDSQAAGDMVGEILDDLKNAASSADQHYNDFQSDKTQITTGPTIKQQRFEVVTPTEAIEVIEEASGMRFWINADKQIVLKWLDDPLAPLPIPSNRVRPALELETDLNSYHSLQLTESIKGTGTKSILPSTGLRSTESITDTFAYVSGNTTVFPLRRRPFSIADITSIRIDGGSALTQLIEDVAIDSNDDPGTGNAAIYIGPAKSNESKAYVRLSTADLSGGESIAVIYKYAIEDNHENIDVELADGELAERTGGDGVHEFVWSRAAGLQIADITEIDAISEVLLERKSKIHLLGQFISFVKGWERGQTFDLISTRFGIDEQVYVIGTKRTVRTPKGNASDPSGGDSWIQTEVTFSNIPRGSVV